MTGPRQERPTLIRVIAKRQVRDWIATDLRIDLPAEWARKHDTVKVVFTGGNATYMGWHVRLEAPNREHILGFPWHDHADEILRGGGNDTLPVELSSGEWWGYEQGWEAHASVLGDEVYIAETDPDALSDVVQPQALPTDDRGVHVFAPEPTQAADGAVSVCGVPINWNRVPLSSYLAAWDAARDVCLAGGPGKAS